MTLMPQNVDKKKQILINMKYLLLHQLERIRVKRIREIELESKMKGEREKKRERKNESSEWCEREIVKPKYFLKAVKKKNNKKTKKKTKTNKHATNLRKKKDLHKKEKMFWKPFLEW